MRSLIFILVLLCSWVSVTANAACARTNAPWTHDHYAANIPFGRVNLTSDYLQPVGSLMGQVMVPPTNYIGISGQVTATTALWICAKKDLDSMYFLVATNGDDGVGGRDEVGKKDGMPNVFATAYKYVGLKLIMDGVQINRYYQAVKIPSYLEVGDKIHVRLMDIPPLKAELYRVSSLVQSGATCYQIASGSYTCVGPNMYIQLHGNGMPSDQIGQDSNTNYVHWGNYNGFGYRMYQGSTLLNQPTCVARSATPTVTFATISAPELQGNQSTQANFNVAIECTAQGVVSGTAQNQTAIGIQVSPQSYVIAQRLGLVNANNGVTALLSDRYDDPVMAKGVGIFLKNANGGEAMNFIGQPDLTGGGAAAGWYPVFDGAQANGSTSPGFTHYSKNYTAILKKLSSSIPVSSGKVEAKAYVLVKVQ